MGHVPTQELRQQFLDLHGIGPETADSILLYALDRPVFVIDAYTVRLLSRLGLCNENVKYDEARALFMDNLEPDTTLFNEYHALIVVHSKRTCSKRVPRCGDCPLSDICAWESKTQDPKSKKRS
jgi:endonuclease-3 related protein